MTAGLPPVAPAPFSLHFTDWQCGHHGERPADIPVSSPRQALLILEAISHAISQPGHAHAVLMNDHFAEAIYISDDHLSIGTSSRAHFCDVTAWAERPVVVFGTAAEIAELHSPELVDAGDALGYWFEAWDGAATVTAGQAVTTTKALAELEAMAKPVEWHEAGQRSHMFDLPPVFLPAGELLLKLRAEAALIAAPDTQDRNAN